MIDKMKFALGVACSQRMAELLPHPQDNQRDLIHFSGNDLAADDFNDHHLYFLIWHISAFESDWIWGSKQLVDLVAQGMDWQFCYKLSGTSNETGHTAQNWIKKCKEFCQTLNFLIYK